MAMRNDKKGSQVPAFRHSEPKTNTKRPGIKSHVGPGGETVLVAVLLLFIPTENYKLK